MAQTLEAIRGGGGSVRVGTVGTISSLMTREIESSSNAKSRHTPVPGAHDNGPFKQRKSMDDASSSGIGTGTKSRSPEVIRKTRRQNQHRDQVLGATTLKGQKHKTPLGEVGNSTIRQAIRRSPDFSAKTRSHKRSYHIPMLGSENIHLEKTPIRDKPARKGSSIVDIVDINCGNPGVSLSSRLKKLGFSKLSQSFM